MTKGTLLLFGGSGQIGSEVVKQLSDIFNIIAPKSGEVDITQRDQVEDFLVLTKPALILDAAGYTNTDGAKDEPGKSFILNCGAVLHLAYLAAKQKIPFYYLSTELIFNGRNSTAPYSEKDQPDPLLINGKTKRLGELATLDASPQNGVIRLIMCYSANYPGKTDLARLAVTRVAGGQEFSATDDQQVNPIYIDHLAEAIKTILQHRSSGLYHVGATDFTTPYQFVKTIITKMGLNAKLVKPTTFDQFSQTRPEPRPKDQWLDTTKFQRVFGKAILKTVNEGVAEFIRDYQKVQPT